MYKQPTQYKHPSINLQKPKNNSKQMTEFEYRIYYETKNLYFAIRRAGNKLKFTLLGWLVLPVIAQHAKTSIHKSKELFTWHSISMILFRNRSPHK